MYNDTWNIGTARDLARKVTLERPEPPPARRLALRVLKVDSCNNSGALFTSLTQEIMEADVLEALHWPLKDWNRTDFRPLAFLLQFTGPSIIDLSLPPFLFRGVERHLGTCFADLPRAVSRSTA